jgi:Zn-dependent protease with chaperone function
MSGLLAAVAAGIVLPHVLHLERVAPVTAISLWLSSLALRAMVTVLAVIYLLFFLPRSELFSALTHWCLDVALPFARADAGVEVHALGDVALFLPGVLLAVSLLWACVATANAARTARRLVQSQALGPGPRDSLIVGGPDVLFAVTGLARPRIVVSAGALACLDDDELGAALDHEQAHITRRHRLLMAVAIALRALGRLLPGSGRAIRELAFHFERDADEWAVRRSNDRLALASVICKAACPEPPPDPPAVTGLGTLGVRERVSRLLEEEPRRQARSATAAFNGLAVGMVACTLLLVAAVPAAAMSGVADDPHRAHHGQHCHH